MKQNNIFDMLLQEDDIKWQTLIYELVRTNKVDPWDVDLTVFTREYIKMIDKLKQLNFRVSGKVVLAAAILLKLKMNRLGLDEFIGLLEEPEEGDEYYLDNEEIDESYDENIEDIRLRKLAEHVKKKQYKLKHKIPNIRTRKVTVFELVSALKKALEVDERREKRRVKIEKSGIVPDKAEFKPRKVDILDKIRLVYERLMNYIKKKKGQLVEFSEITPSKKKEDIIWTFVPLLHLANDGKVNLKQDEPFGKIYVEMLDDNIKRAIKK